MKIIIVGAGQVGGTLAEHLASERNDITLIDKDSNRLRELQDRLDIGTVAGHGSHPGVLARAGAEDAEMLIAVTDSDEINMVACQVAHSMFRTPTRIARIRSHAYTQHASLFSKEAFPIDVIISPENLVTNAIERLIEYPGAVQVLDFADGKAQLVGMKAYRRADGRAAAHRDPQADAQRRHARGGDLPPQPPDPARRQHRDRGRRRRVLHRRARAHRQVMSELRRIDKPYKRVMIAGGGDIGCARGNDRVPLRREGDRDAPERCKLLSERLQHGIALRGSASARELLIAENVKDTDVFCALTNDDEINIMSSLLAKRLGASKVATYVIGSRLCLPGEGVEIDIGDSRKRPPSAACCDVRRAT